MGKKKKANFPPRKTVNLQDGERAGEKLKMDKAK